MKRATWQVLALGALLGAVALPASAQVVIGGSGTPNVEVNWSVLDSLGRQPTLADMLKNEPMPAQPRAAAPVQPKGKATATAGGVQFRPYQPGATSAAKPVKPAKVQAPKPKKSSVVPAAAKSAAMSDLVQSARPAAPEPAAKAPEAKMPEVKLPEVKPVEVPRASAQPPVPAKPQLAAAPEAPKPAAPAIIGPQISLPEVPKPAAPPVQLVKSEPPPAAKAELPPTALTPPPLPAAIRAPEPPQQVAALPPSPAPVAASKSDTLSVTFASESARLSESTHPDLDRLVKRMQKDEGLALQLLAYAEGDDANASKARRLSLSRALEVRKYLMEQGLRSTRIEVRALGNKMEGAGPADRVDAVLVSR